ncbi:hypothetical protein PACTADRAFT_48697 [Pachysolen tannophilus NRRL Y-2460]|uniref:Uncharacterized protein n=1 Tax=Pachysolen tannophilus NRRL Y-2460 TaxID=669874 RepID=A0A1E4TYU2_PACTA|nr:hypothetical protein PACTADRAFT_48697 [Pachysolen tannophilus NRRL Y-2460]
MSNSAVVPKGVASDELFTVSSKANVDVDKIDEKFGKDVEDGKRVDGKTTEEPRASSKAELGIDDIGTDAEA